MLPRHRGHHDEGAEVYHPMMDDPEYDTAGRDYRATNTRTPTANAYAIDEFYETQRGEQDNLLERPSYADFGDGENDMFGEEPAVKRNFWFRTFLIGIVFGVLSVGYVGAALTYHVFLAAGLALAGPVIMEEAAVWFCGCCYPRRKRSEGKLTRDWEKTLQRVVLLFALFFGAGTCAAGYFGRDWYYAEHGVQYDKLVVDDSPKGDVASVTVFSDVGGTAVARPEGSIGGRTLSFGVWPVCVGPIVSDPTQKSVSYWALGHGKCCASQPLSCPNWSKTTQLGGIRAHFTDLYPRYQAAVEDASKTYGLVSDPNAVFVFYGDPNKFKDDLHYTATIVFSATAAVGTLLALYRSCKGPY